jgi:hypothetical protein
MRDWIDVVTDLDFKILGMSDDEFEAFAYAQAEPIEPMTPNGPPRPAARHRPPRAPRALVHARAMQHAA